MPTIAVIDDRTKERGHLVGGIETSDALPEGWDTVGWNPLKSLDEYPNWIIENDIAALVLDERLRENQADVEVVVDYDGHEVVDRIRKTLPTFPIFVVTAVPDDPTINERYANVEAIINRKIFVSESDKLVPRIVRSGQRFFETNENQLARMEELSRKLAIDDASIEEQKELNALRELFQLPYEEQIQTPDSWIAEFEESVKQLRDIHDEISSYVKSKGLDKQ